MDHIYQNPQFGENWFTYPNPYRDMVKKFPSGSKFVEIGSWKGKSAAFMAVEIANSGKNIEFTCVDTFHNCQWFPLPEGAQLYDVFKNNMRPLERYYRDLRMSSLDAAKLFENTSLDFVFIDAQHEYEFVKNDIVAWLPKIKAGGILAGHDYLKQWSGIISAVNELLSPKIEVSELCWIHSV